MTENSSIKITLDEEDKKHISELGTVLVSAREISSSNMSKVKSFTLKSDEVIRDFSQGVWQFKFKLPNGGKYTKLIEIGSNQAVEVAIDLPFGKVTQRRNSRSLLIGKNKYRAKSASLDNVELSASKYRSRKILNALGSYNSKGIKTESSVESFENVSNNIRQLTSGTNDTFDVKLIGYDTLNQEINLWSFLSYTLSSNFEFPATGIILNQGDSIFRFPRVSEIEDSVKIPNEYISNLRRWIEVRRNNSSTLHSLPAKWLITQSGEHAEFEITFRSDFGAKILTQLFVKDVFASDLLSRLNSREIGDALTVAKSAKQYLFEKFENATLAAAGGYILLSTQLNSGAEHNWFSWLENLSNMNEDISDSEVLLGYLYLNGPSEIRNVDRSIEHFKKAYKRGIPHFTLGIVWLLSALRKLKYKDDELEKMYQEVQSLAGIIDPSASFTTFKVSS